MSDGRRAGLTFPSTLFPACHRDCGMTLDGRIITRSEAMRSPLQRGGERNSARTRDPVATVVDALELEAVGKRVPWDLMRGRRADSMLESVGVEK